ncbi:MAG: acetyl-CoA carboxylase biotin carboxylase subunit [Bacteroidales bacterium]|nr:acetyl-CoA carboxylase biotin carboxylase subunit [Bacteroidales bacterium]
MKLFKKILIANRGEIAVRIIRSASELGIRTVAIYATPDEDSLHVEMADEAYHLGDSTELSETYLNIDKIIEIAKESGAEAIHPGYGFLAENPAFVASCDKAGIVFIGPNTKAIKLMGNKIESRAFVKKIGIPMTDGITGDVKTLRKKAGEISLPILVKAAAGGGGKGMRIVHDLKDLPEILESTSREAKSYFGDDTIYIEKYVEEPRHIEIQVIGDNFGNAVHLFERECSIQRRYQKIIEESPSPTLTPEVRNKMGDAAVKIAKKIGYNNAGTVEFLVDKNLNFYFLEMNTRVQVEHPVTEMVTGVDIVREQILIAAGNPLSLKQEKLTQHGHAIECRIYAEDPSNNFRPSPGDMSLYLEPEGENIRIDTGIAEATTIHSFYDPMISKMIVWGEDREIAREKSIYALREYTVHGINTNISFLMQVLKNKAYIENNISTKYCDEHTTDLISLVGKEKAAINPELPAIAYLVYGFHEDLLYPDTGEYNVWKEIGYWRDLMDIKMNVDEQKFDARIRKNGHGTIEMQLNDNKYMAELRAMESGILEITLNGHSMIFYISRDKLGRGFVSLNGHIFTVIRHDILSKEDFFGLLDHGGREGTEIVSPMPGKVIKINVSEGREVKKGDLLLIVEAMKMENNILSPRDGKIEKVNVKAGDMVDGSKELVTLEITNDNQ